MVIGLVGKKHCGKSYFASRLINKGKEFGVEFKRLPLAGALKVLSYSLFRMVFKKDISAVLEYAETFFIPIKEHDKILSKKEFTNRLIAFGNTVGNFTMLKIPEGLINNLYNHYKAFHETGDEINIRRFLQLIGTEFARNLIDENVWVNILDKFISNNPYLNIVIDDVRFPNEFEWLKSKKGITIYIYTDLDTLDTHPSEIYVEELGQKCDYKIYNTFKEDVFDDVIEEILKGILP